MCSYSDEEIQEMLDRISNLEQECAKHHNDIYAHENLKRLD